MALGLSVLIRQEIKSASETFRYKFSQRGAGLIAVRMSVHWRSTKLLTVK